MKAKSLSLHEVRASNRRFDKLCEIMLKYCDIEFNLETGLFTVTTDGEPSPKQEEIVNTIRLLLEKTERYFVASGRYPLT